MSAQCGVYVPGMHDWPLGQSAAEGAELVVDHVVARAAVGALGAEGHPEHRSRRRSRRLPPAGTTKQQTWPGAQCAVLEHESEEPLRRPHRRAAQRGRAGEGAEAAWTRRACFGCDRRRGVAALLRLRTAPRRTRRRCPRPRSPRWGTMQTRPWGARTATARAAGRSAAAARATRGGVFAESVAAGVGSGLVAAPRGADPCSHGEAPPTAIATFAVLMETVLPVGARAGHVGRRPFLKPQRPFFPVLRATWQLSQPARSIPCPSRARFDTVVGWRRARDRGDQGYGTHGETKDDGYEVDAQVHDAHSRPTNRRTSRSKSPRQGAGHLHVGRPGGIGSRGGRALASHDKI